MTEATPRDRAEHALRQANRAAKSGDLAAAERWSKTAERLAATAERLAALPPPPDERQDEEERRAELRRRIAKFIEANEEIEAWERERETYEAQVSAALANNLDPPAPLRPHPAGALGEENYLDAIARGERV